MKIEYKHLLIGVAAGAVTFGALTLYHKATSKTCHYKNMLLMDSETADPLPGTFTFEDFGDSIVIEDAGEHFATFVRGVDGTYKFKGVHYTVAYGDEDISFLVIDDDFRFALIDKTCE